MLKKFKSKEVDIWFTSDIHGFHKNITRGTSQWDGSRSLRDFNDPELMTYEIVDGINKYVKPDDILFDSGDWTFDGIERIWELRKMINCKNIYKICGNHDLKIFKNQLLPNVYFNSEDFNTFRDFPDDFYFDLNEESEITDSGNKRTYAQDLFVETSLSDLIQIDKKLVYLSHFPCEEVRFDQPSIHLHGHVHGKGLDDGRLDVGIDNAFELFGEYRPFHWNDVIEFFKNQ